MNVQKYLPSVPAMTSEAVAVLVGTVVAAFIISKFPALREFVVSNAIVIRDQTTSGFINES